MADDAKRIADLRLLFSTLDTDNKGVISITTFKDVRGCLGEGGATGRARAQLAGGRRQEAGGRTRGLTRAWSLTLARSLRHQALAESGLKDSVVKRAVKHLDPDNTRKLTLEQFLRLREMETDLVERALRGTYRRK